MRKIAERIICGIYALVNENPYSKEKGFGYIGQSTNIHKRLDEHYSTFLGKTCSHFKLYQAMEKWGVNNFVYHLIEECEPSQLNMREIYWIDMYQTQVKGYNMEGGGSWGRGTNHPRSVFTEDQIRDILYQLKSTDTKIADIARKYRVVPQIVSAINLGLTYRQDNTVYPIREYDNEGTKCRVCGVKIKSSSVLCRGCWITENSGDSSNTSTISNKIAQEIKENLRDTDTSPTQIAQEYGINVGIVYQINSGSTWRSVGDFNYPIRTQQVHYNRCVDCNTKIREEAKRCTACYHKSRRKVERPSREEFKNLIRNYSFSDISEHFGICKSNALQNWCRDYGLPHRKREISKMSDEDWDKA